MSPRHLPVACGGVLAGRLERTASVAGDGPMHRSQALERPNIRQTPSAQVRQREATHPRNVPQRVATRVAILRRVGHLADAHAVENDPHHARETHCVITCAWAALMRAVI